MDYFSRYTNVKNKTLTENELNFLAPSIFTVSEKEQLTNRYNFIPTFELVQTLKNNGWFPVHAAETRVRNQDNKGFQKHMIRFRNLDLVNEGKLSTGDSVIEMVLTNSHDGLSSFKFMAGVFRLVCKNGLTVSEGAFQNMRIRHDSYEAEKVIEITKEIIKKTPVLLNSIEEMRSINLNNDEQLIFAESAKILRFGNDSEYVNSSKLINRKRYDDEKNDLYTTLNVVQEHLVRGGIRYSKPDSRNRYKTKRSKEIKSIDNNTKLNQALWTLAEKMKELKSA